MKENENNYIAPSINVRTIKISAGLCGSGEEGQTETGNGQLG